MTNFPKAVLILVSVLAITAMGATFLLRLRSVSDAEATPPGTAQTSGCEEESMFAVWRAVHGQPVYANATKIPFASAYFNWLYYYGYAFIIKNALPGDDGSKLPHLGRRITAVSALLGGLFAAGLLAAIAGTAQPGLRWLGIALGAAVFFSPLPGWWTLTLRPDVAALAFETAAIALLLALHRRHPLAALCGALLLFYAAWACKQTYVAGLFTTGLFMLVHRRWRDLGIAILAWLLMVGLTMALFGDDYRASIRDHVHLGDLYFSAGVQNAVSSGKKLLPLLLGLPILIATWRCAAPMSAKRSLASDAFLFGCIGSVLSICLALPAGSKVGASVNYYFSVFLMLAIAVTAAARLSGAKWTPLLVGGALLLLNLVPLSGRAGTLSLQPERDKLAARWALWQRQPEPRYSSDLRLNLPWLVPHSPPFVLAFNYHRDRTEGRTFERGGVGGLIESGYFASLLLFSPVATEYDRSHLGQYYRPKSETAGMVLYQREEKSAAPASPTR